MTTIENSIEEILLDLESHFAIPAITATNAHTRAKTELLKWLGECIGEDEIQKPNDEDYSDYLVCERCECILIDESDPPNACNCTIRNQLRAELRKKVGL